jgi:MFS family permease
LSATSVTEPTDAPSVDAPSRFGALRHSQFRRFWLGSIFAVGAFNLNMLAQGILVFDLTGSALDLGTLGLATAVPTITVTLFGGVLADRIDRRKLLMGAQIVLAILLALLATLVVTDVIQVWHVYVIAFFSGLATGIDWPTRNAMFPTLLEDRSQMMSAVALSAILWQGSRIIVPTTGGFIIAAFGPSFTFFIAAAAFLVMFVTLMTLKVPATPKVPGRNPLHEFIEGVLYIGRTKLFAILIPLTFSNMLFGMMYIQLMPAYVDLFGGSAREIGYVFTGVGIGAVLGTFVVGRYQQVAWLGWMILTGAFLSAALIFLFAISPYYWVSVVLAGSVGFFNSMYQISSMTVLQLRVPEGLRGRVMGIFTITYSLIPLGGFFGGVIADFSSVRVAIATGGVILTGIVILVAITQPQIRSLDGRVLEAE